MSNKRRKARWRRKRAALLTASFVVVKQEVLPGNPALPDGWFRWESGAFPPAAAREALWVPEECNRHLKDAARGLESIGYPLCPPAPIMFPPPSFCVTLPRKHGRSGVRC